MPNPAFTIRLCDRQDAGRVWGKYDELANPAGADRLADAIPGSHKVLIDGAGHLPQLEKSEEFNRIVGEFLR